MLLEKGIIPLFIQDGGISTEETTRSWSTTFPFIKLSSFEQAKRRACFEFLVPHPRRKHALRFHDILGKNIWNYGVQVRMSSQTEGSGAIGSWEQPYESESFTLSVGAESVLQSILPLLPDKPLKTTRSKTVDGLGWYLKDGDAGNIPLLHHTLLCIVRIEAVHWGPAELDSFVLGCAEKAGMKYDWPADVAQREAARELERRGLVTKVD